MAVRTIRKISSWTLLAVFIISFVVLAVYFFGGDDEPYGINAVKNPNYTSLLLVWCYFMFGVCAIGMIMFGLTQFISKFRTNPKGALVSLGILAGFVVLLFIGYSMGDITPLPGINTDSQQFNTPFWLKVTDMWLYAMYIFIVLAICATIWGSLKKILSR